jgi:uncharacterized membrane protein HdeD (DUF308 family)
LNAALARRWWLIALRGAAVLLFGLMIVVLPAQMGASIVLLCAAYLAADGALAILAGSGATRRGVRRPMLTVEGTINLAAAAALVWPAVVALPLITVASAWAVITGALLLAAARRVAPSYGRWLLLSAGTTSAAWGGVAAVPARAGLVDPATWALWLVAYGLVFGAILIGLAVRLLRRHRDAVPE